MLAHSSSQWWRNAARSEGVLYKIENEMVYHHGHVRVFETNQSDKVHAALDLFRKKYGKETIDKWYGRGQGRVVVEMVDES